MSASLDPCASATPAVPSTLVQQARETLDRAVDNLLRQQVADGYWCAELEGDSILESEYILLKWIIDQEHDPRIPKIANYLRRLQREDGSWGQYPGSSMDLSATVKGYFALKLCGDRADAPHMVRARTLIHRGGGAEQCNSFTKFYLAATGQIRYQAVPSIPPEMIYLPKWFYFHLDKVSAWTRTMITPLSIVTSHRPVRKIPTELGIDELYLDQRMRHRLLPFGDAHRTWATIFCSMDRMLKLVDRAGMTPLRNRALSRIEDWIIERTDRSDGLGAIFPPMVYILIALKCRGYSENHPKVLEAHKHLNDLMIHDQARDEIRIQPCFSPIWDTGIAAYALTETGLDRSHPAMERCAQWLITKECRHAGDWAANVKQPVEPSGWYFEYNNGFYPDVDDTAMVAMALKRMGGEEALAASRRGVDWIFAMQNDDGGWAAFDRTTERPLLEHVPFADHNAIQDPSCPDIAGRTLECLGHHGFSPDHPAVRRAIRFIRSKQELDGCWFGRWGINYIYGTWQVVCGLKTIGYDMRRRWVRRAGLWLKSIQKPDGSFGESAETYLNPATKGAGPSTASQTSWGAMAMMAVYGPEDPDVQRAIAWLCQHQIHQDSPETGDMAGSWIEPWFTGTGFPRVFYLRYHLYRVYFPVMCLGRWLGAMTSS
ncbi:MAG: squalene--hopene cyclase [Phycisphaeraceae bacterium]|nr:squalene--hopene cyclase [Phycisphaeraceae bacterium]